MSKFKVTDPVRVTLPGYWFDLVGTVDDIAPQEFSIGVTFPDKAPCNFRESELILADVVEANNRAFVAGKDMAEQEIDGERVRGASVPKPEPVKPIADWELELLSGRRSVILRTAGNLINGQRAKDYGDAGENFQRIADLWSPVLGKTITPEQVALCMAQVKIARLITSPAHEDSWIDLSGYAALGGEIAAAEAAQ